MYEVYVATQFEAAHRLVGDFGPATRIHGHTYRLEVLVRGERLSEDGTLYDIGELRAAVDDLASSLHYRDLNEVQGLEDANTTAEAVADYCWERLAPLLRDGGLDSLCVRLWESPQVYAARDAALA
jgi:6-pyruvoyltetrahydropterin/6-carboxytetrahydropterin synthase